ncbi:hypothetical protein [Streptomyces sp. NPDC059651]|uniref:hypothetical protein n=1 Tax=Streptomyces sp. NPDC059651 TaxID=3346897 RepID=UPI000AACD88E
MRIRNTAAAITAVLAFAAVGCSSDNGTDSKADTPGSSAPEASSQSSHADDRGTATDTGLPPEPTGVKRDAVLAVVLDVNSNLVHDEDKAIDAARNQCAALNGGAMNPDHAAAQRFSYDGITLTDDDGGHLNTGLRKTLCPGS